MKQIRNALVLKGKMSNNCASKAQWLLSHVNDSPFYVYQKETLLFESCSLLRVSEETLEGIFRFDLQLPSWNCMPCDDGNDYEVTPKPFEPKSFAIFLGLEDITEQWHKEKREKEVLTN